MTVRTGPAAAVTLLDSGDYLRGQTAPDHAETLSGRQSLRKNHSHLADLQGRCSVSGRVQLRAG